MKILTKTERELFDRLKDIETRLSVLEALPVPIVFAIGRFPEAPLQADMQRPSELEH